MSKIQISYKPHYHERYRYVRYIDYNGAPVAAHLFSSVAEEQEHTWFNGFLRGLDVADIEYDVLTDTSEYDPVDTIKYLKFDA